MGSSILIGLIVGLAVAAFMIAKYMKTARSKTADAATIEPAKRSVSLSTPLEAGAAFEKLRRAAIGRFRLADSNAGRNVLVYETPMTLFSFGFFFPVFGRPAATGSMLELGIESKTNQRGPVVTNTHKEFVAEVEKALGAR